MSITVSLNTSVKPPVTVSPNPYDVSQGTAETITWVPASGQTFAFKSLTFANNPACFGTPNVSNTQITVQDTNNNAGPAITYTYTIVVSYNGQSYSSATTGPGGTGGDPGIRNR